MIKKNLIKSLSVVMAAMLAVMTVACGHASTDAAQAIEAAADATEEKEIEESIVKTPAVASTESDAGKVETVYVTADANGAVNDVIVSEWLKNVTASTELADSTELKDIVNVKGSETFTDNGDGTLTWNAEGSDIYYQGTTDKELPVTMKITYTLDGKEISPEELAGKSGRVTMRFEYQNNAKQTVKVNGKDIEVYTPFAMVSGMMLDADKFTNVEISNGKVISDGGNYVVMGVATPGLKESLSISDEKWDELEDGDEIKEKLSNSFEITADTTDFELGMTITMASSDILSDFGMSDLANSDKLNDVKDDMGKLQDGSTQLVDGTKKLKDGTTELRDGTGKLYDGTKDLEDGAKKLYDGTTELSDGASKLYDGTGTLASGTGALADGASKLCEGVKAYTDGAGKINDGAVTLADGLKTAKAGSSALKKGMDDKKLVESANQITVGAKLVTAKLGELEGQMDGLYAAMDGLSELQSMKVQAAAAKAYLEGSGSWDADTATGMYVISAGKVDCKEKADALIAGVSATKEGLSGVGTGAQGLSEGAAGLNEGAGQLNAGLSNLATGLLQLEAALGGGSSEGAEETASEPVTVTQDENQEENIVEFEEDTITNPSEDAGDDGDGEGKGSDDGQGDGEGSGEDAGDQSGDGNNGSVEGAGTPEGNGTETGSAEGSSEEADKNLAGAEGENTSLTEDGENAGATETGKKAKMAVLGATSADPNAVVLGDSDVVISQEKLDALMEYKAFYDKYGSVVAGLPTLAGKIHEAAVGAQTLSAGASSLSAGTTALSEGAAQLAEGAAKLPQGIEAVAAYNQLIGSASGIIGAIDQIQAEISASGMSFDDETVKGLKDSIEQLKFFAAGSGQMAGGVVSIYDATSKIDEGLGKLSSGADQLAEGTKTLTSKNGELVDGASQLSDGAGKLNSGAGELRDGAGKLSSGARELSDGAGKLHNGTVDLMDGAGKLNDGVITLDDGVQELLDGVIKLDKEGISKLYEAFDGDLTDFADRMTAIQEAGENYKTFGGSSDDVDSSVKFIIRTDAVKEL